MIIDPSLAVFMGSQMTLLRNPVWRLYYIAFPMKFFMSTQGFS